jgi:hypothetical protein
MSSMETCLNGMAYTDEQTYSPGGLKYKQMSIVEMLNCRSEKHEHQNRGRKLSF